MTQATTLTTSTLGERLSEHELCPDDLLAGQRAAYARDIARVQQRAAELEAAVCPACRSGDARPVFEKYGFQFQSCQACRTIYMSPRPSPAVMADYYANSENYAYWATHIFPASEAARREKLHKPRVARLIDYCDRHGVRRGTLLEVGPGFGTFAAVATESGAFERVVAVEPTPEMAAACRSRGVEVFERRIEDVGGELGEVDIVVAFEVIEHLMAPAQFIAQCATVLKPGGLMLLTCPNGLGFDIAVLGPKSWAVDLEHVNLFNPASLSALIARSGFDVLEATTPGRLDAEFVHDAAVAGEIDLSANPFLHRVLVEEWDRLGWPFQEFLAAHSLSSHMWVAARKR